MSRTTVSHTVMTDSEVAIGSKSFTALTDTNTSTLHLLQHETVIHTAMKHLASMYFFIVSKEVEPLTVQLEVAFHNLTTSKETLLYAAPIEIAPEKVLYLPLMFNQSLPLDRDTDIGALKVDVFVKSTRSRRLLLSPEKLLVRHEAVFQSSGDFSSNAVSNVPEKAVSVKNEAKKSNAKRKERVPYYFPAPTGSENPFLFSSTSSAAAAYEQQVIMARALQQYHQQNQPAPATTTTTEETS